MLLLLTANESDSLLRQEERDEVTILQQALLHYLDGNAESDPSLEFSKRFYLAQWYKDAVANAKVDASKAGKAPEIPRKFAKRTAHNPTCSHQPGHT